MTNNVVQLHKDTPRDDQDAPAPQAATDRPEAYRPRHRVRIDSLRRVFVDTRQHDTYRFTVRRLRVGRYPHPRPPHVGGPHHGHAPPHDADRRGGRKRGDGDQVGAAYAYRFARHKRRMDLLQMALNAPKALFSGVVAAAGLLLALGIVIAWYNHNVRDVLAPLNAVIQFVGWVAFLASVIWEPLLYSMPLLVLVGVWSVGRSQRSRLREVREAA
ncbi:hypothetical protein ACWEQN_41315 [Streptomyces sp. NPDC004129]|uniref:hypothetical protein n=1 Tax=Streptomyces sp. NPDC002573 TaxID=3364651 RepID=UPI0036BE374D